MLAGIDGLWGLIVDHQHRCSYEEARELIRQMQNRGSDSARRKLLQMIQYDIEIRRLVSEKGGGGSDMTAFLFGRPMNVTLKAEGLNLIPNPQKIMIFAG